jgi:polyisoprenoid-binding protein YceI
MSETATLPTAQTWNIDAGHSSIDFKVRHMAISTTKGNFKTFTATATTEGGVLKGLEATIEAASVDTNDEKRDGHLKSADFFDTENHPKITVKSTNVKHISGNTYEITADVTMRGVTKPATFKAEVGAPVKDPWGMQRAAANITGKLNRKDWGLNWNMVLEMGGLMVSEEVTFDFDVEMVAQA